MLRQPAVTSALIGARTVEQPDNSLDAVKKLDAVKNLNLSEAGLAEIDRHAGDGQVDIRKASSVT